eukprot:g8779.t1
MKKAAAPAPSRHKGPPPSSAARKPSPCSTVVSKVSNKRGPQQASGSSKPFPDLVYAKLREVPYGRITTYGDIAKALHLPKHSRHVGFALRDSPQGIPWWRCVNGTGAISVKDRLGVAAQAQQPEIVDAAVGVAEMGELEDAHAKTASAVQQEPKSAALIQREKLQAEGHKFIGKQLLEFNKARHHF